MIGSALSFGSPDESLSKHSSQNETWSDKSQFIVESSPCLSPSLAMAKRRKQQRPQKRKHAVSARPSRLPGGSIMPRTTRTYLKYCSVITLVDSGVASVPTTYVFNCSSLFDPDVTGTGHQPMGFDQLALFYNHYTVLGCRLTVEFIGDYRSHSCTVGILPQAGPSPLTSVEQILEQPLVRVLSLTGGYGAAAKAILSSTVAPHRWYGSKPFAKDQLTAAVTASPLESVYFHVFMAPNRTLSDTNVHARVTLVYDSAFQEPKTLVQS